MPSGEVFSSPIENSVNGTIYFDYPTVFMGHEVAGVTLNVSEGKVIDWQAEKGKEFLDHIFTIDGARHFGEVAIGTNYQIQNLQKTFCLMKK